jgi:hypothetical protein
MAAFVGPWAHAAAGDRLVPILAMTFGALRW